MTAAPARAVQYSPGDWVSYTDLRYVSSVAADLRFVYAGTTQGIAVVDRIKGRWGDPITTGDGLPNGNVEVVGIDRYTNRLLAASGASIYTMDQETETWQSYSVQGAGSGFKSIAVDMDYIWAEGPGIKVRFDKATGGWHSVNDLPKDIEWFGERGEVDIERSEYSFLAPFYVLGEDLERYDYTAATRSETSLWLGTWGFGAYEYDLLTRSGRHFLMGIAGGRADAICLDEEVFWFGSASPEAPGITSWRTEGDVWSYYSKERGFGILSNRVSTIAADSDFIWIGTEDGLTRLRKENGSFKTYTLFDGLPANEVTAVHVAGESLWVGTSSGLCVSARASWAPSGFDELRTWVNDILVLEDTLWVATEDGVFVRDIRAGKWSEFEDPEGLLAISTVALLADAGKMWFATWRGVLCFDGRSGKWERFTSPVYLPHELVRAIGADEENVWVGTASGVARFIKDTGDWERYGLSDGLIGAEVSAIVCGEACVYFGTDRGVTRFCWSNPFITR